MPDCVVPKSLTLCHQDRFSAYLRTDAPPRRRPGSSLETLLMEAALRNCDLSNWTPAFAGEVSCQKVKMPAIYGDYCLANPSLSLIRYP